jgi:uncharacterized protein
VTPMDAAMGLPVTAVPSSMLAGAWVLLGVWLGSARDRDLFRRAGGFVSAALASTLLMIALCVGTWRGSWQRQAGCRGQ